MALLGQASGGFTESSSALRILHVGIRNTVGVLTADSFTQANPPVVPTSISDQTDTSTLGVLSGSVAFSRGDGAGGSNEIGGPVADASCQPVGCFINTANGNSFENTPGSASGKGPYVSAQGCYANALFETEGLGGDGAITYTTGDHLVASRNGYLTTINGVLTLGGAETAISNSHCANLVDAGTLVLLNSDTDVLIGVLKMPFDATQDEIVYDQRI